MLAQVRAITSTDFFAAIDVLGLIGHIHDQPRDLLRTAAGLNDNGYNIPQRAIELCYEVFADDRLVLIPTDLSGDEQQPATGVG